MNRTEATEVGMLLKTLEDADDWRATFETNRDLEKHALVVFEEINMRRNEDADTRHNFDGELRMSREMAIAMMTWLAEKAQARLRELGVEVEA